MIDFLFLPPAKLPNYDLINANLNRPAKQVQVAFTGNNTVPSSTYKAYVLPNKPSFKGFSQEFRMPKDVKGPSFDQVIDNYKTNMSNVIFDFNSRKDRDGQFLKWVELPANQLKTNVKGESHVDQIYTQAQALKNRKNSDGSTRPLVVLGIGGSKHTAEFLLNMNGQGNKGKVYFYSDIDPISYNNFKEETGKSLKEMNFLVVSKSGTTFETADAFKRFEDDLVQEYKKDGFNENQAKLKAQEHFAICTDAKATDKNLRGKVGDKNGEGNNYIKELYIHDDVGGRFSMFDDPGIFTIAYADVPKSDAVRILTAAKNTSEKLTKTDDIKNNSAAKSAILNVHSRKNGYNMIQQQYYGKIFESGGENWAKQLYLESLKDFDFAVGKAPDSMHYGTEGHFDDKNRKKYHKVMTVMDPKISNNYKTYLDAIAATYNETAPLKMEVLETEGNKIKPEAIGEYIQSKHFETVYMGMLRRKEAGQTVDLNKALPEVLQPSVETYKNKFKPGGGYTLTPGGQ